VPPAICQRAIKAFTSRSTGLKEDSSWARPGKEIRWEKVKITNSTSKRRPFIKISYSCAGSSIAHWDQATGICQPFSRQLRQGLPDKPFTGTHTRAGVGPDQIRNVQFGRAAEPFLLVGSAGKVEAQKKTGKIGQQEYGWRCNQRHKVIGNNKKNRVFFYPIGYFFFMD
jgi:hypothetical protein